MPFSDVTDIVLNEEAKEVEHAYQTNTKVRAAIDQFEAECKLRRELVEARKSNDLTQAELKERTGLTQQTISRIEKNTDISPSLKNLIRYANAIGYEITLTPKKENSFDTNPN